MEENDIRLKNLFHKIRQEVDQSYSSEIEFCRKRANWHEQKETNQLNSSDLLQELVWAVLSSELNGVKKFQCVRKAFKFFSPTEIAENPNKCVSDALACFNKKASVDVIVAAAQNIRTKGINAIITDLKTSPDPVKFLQEEFMFVGKAEIKQLIKNLGVVEVAPDNQLVNVSKACGFNDVDQFLVYVADLILEPKDVVELIILSYSELHPATYLTVFKELKK